MEPDVLKARLHVLARAVVRQRGKILLARAKGFHNTFLPGGHLEPGESLRDCLRRELHEELGLRALVGAYLGVIQHTYEDAEGTHLELSHLFGVSFGASAKVCADGLVVSQEPHLTFVWAEQDRLAEYDLEPYPLRRLLKEAHTPPSALWASTLLSEPNASPSDR